MDTLTRIRAFIDVVEAEGFSAAARKTGRSKALLSKYVRELEDDLGALLLNRTTRQFSLTEAGHTYYRTASDILKEIDNLADLVREKNADLKGKLRISVPRTFIDADVGQSLIDFAKENPELSLEIVADDRFVDLIEEGFDLAIRITRLEDSGLIARKISDFRVYAVATADFVARHGPLNGPQDFSRVPFIIDTNTRFHNTVRYLEADGGSNSVTISGPIEVNSPQATLRAARAGLGIAMVPDFIARPFIQSGELVTLFDDYISKDRGIYAVYPHRRYLPAKVRSFVDYLSAWFRKNG
ncbi:MULTISPECIES: LysR family transcriptional regulator [Rhizobium/Agrobacterium group]|jgi:DNA-binding transcriptional LysR family regulator|uniref:HTH-type transcriptional regulator TtuA n=2 Tax=Rhizobium/Agrobacterium group TaxID=227290 RepID=A0A1B9TUB9_AGRTU|nr:MULTISPECIES: LysR family transcriptional regulator [Rhizobium/Agrobacterium group]AHK03031.1 HTHmotif:LysR substrate binding domain bacterial regulatory protein LysR [Agrobacterium tumefaciens LBA4213 (Ach5)]AKC08822.1 LysR family transcriptional regulator [Agrobacterium tumefaciens]EHJ99816.1 LysR family transcriptional regulator [Agrobacterium tumefaciens 5A]MDP9561785.1 DNA-binding transcriptional LysR family regulator [Rhizobium nepotum]ADY66361.1 transcriptional regulator, LysR family